LAQILFSFRSRLYNWRKSIWGTGGIQVPSFTGDLVLSAGATLTLNYATLKMNTLKNIIINKNANLHINNSTITKSDNGSQWKGILFEISSNLSAPDIPGAVHMSWSTISETKLVFSKSGGSKSGSISASNSTFTDNEKIAQLSGATPAYVHGVIYNTDCNFTRCVFNSTYCSGTAPTLFTFTNLRNIIFRGCKFYNGCLNIINCVECTNCSVTFEESSPLFQSTEKCEFYGFNKSPSTLDGEGTCISVINNLAYPDAKVVISNCIFSGTTYNYLVYDANDRAITLKGCSNPEVVSNTIEIEYESNRNKHGIFLEDCSGFKVEGNEITATGISTDSEKIYGILVQNAGIQTNQIYRNTLTDCPRGIQAQGKNRGPGDFTFPDQGLKLLCNSFTSFNSAYYIYSAVCTTCTTNNSLSQFQQGALSLTAANNSPNFNYMPDRSLASSATNDFFVAGALTGYNIIYMVPKNPGNYDLRYFTNTAITRIVHSSTSPVTTHCQSRLPCSGRWCPTQMPPYTIENYSESYGQKLDSLGLLVNGGDHDELYTLVSNVRAQDVQDVYDELMSSTPSFDIIALACSNELFTAEMVENILIENNYGIRSIEVRDALNGREDLLSEAQMSNIYEASDSLSKFERLMMEVDNINTEYMYLMNSSLDALCRRDSIPVDSVKLYLAAIGDFLSTMKLIELALLEQDTTTALNLFDNISETTDDEDEIDDYSTLFSDILYDIYTNYDGDFDSLSYSQRAIIDTLSKKDTYASGIARYLRYAFDGYSWPDVYCGNDTSFNERRANPVIENDSTAQFVFYPNPAQNSITVIIQGNDECNAQLEIIDMRGSIVLKQSLTEQTNVVSVSKRPNGMYLLKVTLKGEVQMAKLILNNYAE
jgi:parallel beta-helix repeat protein